MPVKSRDGMVGMSCLSPDFLRAGECDGLSNLRLRELKFTANLSTAARAFATRCSHIGFDFFRGY